MSFTTSSASSNPASANSRPQSPAEFLHPLSALYPHVEAMQPPQLYKAIPDWYMEEGVDASYSASVAADTPEPSSPSAASFSSQRSDSPSHRSRAMSNIRRNSCSSSSLRSTSSQGSQDPY